MKLLTKANGAFDRTLDILIWAGAMIFFAVWFVIVLEIVLRYFLNRPLFWVVEVSEYSLLYICFLGAAWLLRREGHVKIDFLVNRLQPKNEALLNAITSVLAAMVCLVLVWYGARTTWINFQRGISVVSTLRPPKFLLLLIIPLGSLMLFIQFLRRAWGYLGLWTASPGKD